MDLKRVLRLAGPAAAVVAVWAAVGWRGPSGDITEAEDRIAAAQATSEAAAAQVALAAQQEAQSELLRAQVDLFSAAVPDTVDQAGLFRLFDELGDGYDVELGALQITVEEVGSGADLAFSDQAADPAAGGGETGAATTTLPAETGGAGGAGGAGGVPDPGGGAGAAIALETITITTTVTGPYTQVLDFIDGLLAAQRLFVLDELTLAPSGDDPDEIMANLSLRTFARPATPTATDPTGGAADTSMSFEEVG